MSILCLSDVACNIAVTMPCLSNNQRLLCIGMLEAGMHQRDVARIMGFRRETIARLLQRYRETDSMADCPWSGRSKVTTEGQDRYIRITHLHDRFLPASQTAAVTIEMHDHAVCDETNNHRGHSH